MSVELQIQEVLDTILADPGKSTSSIQTILRSIDADTGEQLVMILYRVRMIGESVKKRGFPLLSELDGRSARRI
jgi:hypothetical protein